MAIFDENPSYAYVCTHGESWIDFHCSGEPQKLFQERRQLEMLDTYAGNTAAGLRFAEKFADWRSALREIEALETGATKKGSFRYCYN